MSHLHYYDCSIREYWSSDNVGIHTPGNYIIIFHYASIMWAWPICNRQRPI